MESLEIRLWKAYNIMDNTQLWALFNARFHPASQKYYLDRTFMIDCLMRDNFDQSNSECDSKDGNKTDD